MAASLEVRSPFLSSALIDFLTGIHPSYKLRGTTGKHLLRRLMKGRIPDAIIDRKKHGFGVPLGAWMRTTLSPLVQDMLSPSRVLQGGMLEPSVVQTLVDEHLGNRRDHGKQLWP